MSRQPLYYTFGNHMHWVDMQWLWGYDVLPGSVRDMLALAEATGARGNVNFDAVGYERMAAECPEALAALREAIAAGIIEPVGCSYGQPYGLFHGGESNVRQLTLGVRTTRRLLGVRPRAFWEEEFYFFPQLPQMLGRCGYTGACLFFQWTWHTPEVPTEPCSLIWWEGIDGTRLPTLPRHALNVHQWPEDFDGLLDKAAAWADGGPPAVVQWLELMPSRDWMCRAEVLLPRLRELMADPRFDVRPRTLSALIAELAEARRAGPSGGAPPVRRYTMDEVWHGMSLGKNMDRHPRASREVEQAVLRAEAIAATASLLGRPFPSWDVYPAWELDEAWRLLLAAQHHDNHECEGLCGFVGHHHLAAAELHASEVYARTRQHLADRCGRPLVYNALGFEHTVVVQEPSAARAVRVPPFGYAAVDAPEAANHPALPRAHAERTGDHCTLWRGALEVEIDTSRAVIVQVRSPAWPDGLLREERPLLGLAQIVGGAPWTPPPVHEVDVRDGEVTIWFERDPAQRPDAYVAGGAAIAAGHLRIALAPDADAVDVELHGVDAFARPDPGYRGALRTFIEPRFAVESIRADTPYAIQAVRGGPDARRKYPTADWMTSPQWFEEVRGSIFAHGLLDLLDVRGCGLLVLHNGTPQYFRTGAGVEAILNLYDPWDEARYEPDFNQSIALRLAPHAGLRDADRVRMALAFAHGQRTGGRLYLDRAHRDHPGGVGGGGAPGDSPIGPVFGAVEVAGAPGVLAHAFYREPMKAGEHLPDWAGHRMARESAGACTHPFVIRLVEWNGEPAEVTLKLPGPVALAAKTNLMGEVGPRAGGGADTGWLEVLENAEPPAWGRGLGAGWSAVRFAMRPHEIATIMADLVLGRKPFRDLDARREVWATVHRQA